MTEDGLREIVSRIARIDPAQLNADSQLKAVLGNSLGLAKLDAALRSKFGISEPTVYGVRTFGDLCSLLSVGPSSDVITAPLASNPPIPSTRGHGTSNNISIGVDVESIAAMQGVSDYWDDDFYKNTFTPQEIAYALLQASPQASFAAMWCAKEAFRKSNATLAQLDWQRIEVVHDNQGKPGLLLSGQPVQGALSLSHTDEIAFAVFVAVEQFQTAAPAISIPEVSTGRYLNVNSRATAMIAAFALIASILALVVSLLRH
jgi:holo-[acyl-carrier protein] synthase